jgi:uncharacterized SAM-binding protein YcdF (DUF218 family)
VAERKTPAALITNSAIIAVKPPGTIMRLLGCRAAEFPKLLCGPEADERCAPRKKVQCREAGLNPKRRSSVRHAWWLVPIFVVLAIAAAWMARAPILRGMAEWWVVSDPVDRADAIVILGGRLDVRPFAAAALYKRGVAQQVLFSRPKPGPIDTLRLLPQQTELNRQILGKLGVPNEAMVEFGDGVSSTYEEARALVDWVRSSGARSLIIPTDLFTTRRIRWILQRQLDPLGVRVIVQANEPPEYKVDEWWRSENGFIEFQNEVIKYVFYRLKY